MDQEKTSLVKRPNNLFGRNGFTKENKPGLTPYTLKYMYAMSLIDEGKTIREIQYATGLCKQTINRLKKGEIKLATEIISQVKKYESAKLSTITHTILDAITDEDLHKASLLQKTTAASQLIDKRRLIDGESTENVSVQSMLKNMNAYSDKLADRLKEID